MDSTPSHLEDFARMVSLMGLERSGIPSYKIESEKVPDSRQHLMSSGDLPSIEETPDDLKWIIKQTRRRDEQDQEQLGSQGQPGLLDVLGLYKPDSERVVRYDLLIQLVALKRDWPVEALQRIVHWHELAHAANHLGLDQEGSIWKGFAFESSDVLEYFAQIYTFKMLVETGDNEALAVMEGFTPHQPLCYQTYLMDKGKKLEEINLALLEARRRAPVHFPHFEKAFSSSWGIKFDGFWQEQPEAEQFTRLVFLTIDQPHLKKQKRPMHGSEFHISGLKIKIKSYDYSPSKSVLKPEVAYRLFEITSAYLAQPAPAGGLDGSRGECWNGEGRRRFSTDTGSGKVFWEELCDALSIEIPTFARLLRKY